jgi:hypothetical protein
MKNRKSMMILPYTPIDSDDVPEEGDNTCRNSVCEYNSGSNKNILLSNKGNVKNKSKLKVNIHVYMNQSILDQYLMFRLEDLIENLRFLKLRDFKSLQGTPLKNKKNGLFFNFANTEKLKKFYTSTRSVKPILIAKPDLKEKDDFSFSDIDDVKWEVKVISPEIDLKQEKGKKRRSRKTLKLKYIRDHVDLRNSSSHLLANIGDLNNLLQSEDE